MRRGARYVIEGFQAKPRLEGAGNRTVNTRAVTAERRYHLETFRSTSSGNVQVASLRVRTVLWPFRGFVLYN